MLSALAPFAIAMLPDTQYYSAAATLPMSQMFTEQTQWVVDNIATKNIALVTQVGDIVDDPSVGQQWVNADRAMDLLDGNLTQRPDGLVPCSVAMGNHDYLPMGSHGDGTAATFVNWFGPSRYAGRSWFGGASDAPGIAGVNQYQVFAAGGYTFLHIALEYDARQASIDWVNSVIHAHPNLPVILTTHSYLDDSGSLDTSTPGAAPAYHSGSDIYDQVVKPNSQVFLVLCGHLDTAFAQTTDAAGKPVYEMMADYQNWANGGNGYMRLLNFLPDQNRVDVTSFSPHAGVPALTDAADQFSFNLNFADRFNFAAKAPPALAVVAAGGTYNGTVYPATVTVAGADGIARPSLEGVNPALTYYTGNTASGTGSTTAPVAAGTYTVVAAFPGSDNYASVTSAPVIFSIAPKALTVMADNRAKIYGAALPALTVTCTGFVNGDSLATLTAKPTAMTAATAASGVGTYAIVPSGGSAANYTFQYVAGTLTVTPAPLTVTAGNKSKVYGAALPALTVTCTGFVNGDSLASLAAKPSAMTWATAASGVGMYAIVPSGGSAANYSFQCVAGTLTVTPALLTITADDKTMRVSGPLPVLTCTYRGFVNGDTAGCLKPGPSLSTKANAKSPVGKYKITVAGAANPNYAITYCSGTLTVSRRG